MFRKAKPSVTVVARMGAGHATLKRPSMDAQLEKPLEFASIPLDRIVAVQDPVNMAIQDLAIAAAKRSKPVVRLSAGAKVLAEKLSAEIDISELRNNFPSVLNRIADTWASPSQFYELIDSFLMDERGNRQGFPFEALKEIATVLEHYSNFVAPRKATIHDATALRRF